MRTKLSLSFLALAFTSLLSSPVFALSGKDAEDAVSNTIKEVKSIVAQNKGKLPEAEIDKKIETVLLPNFDFEQMSKSSLGSGWKKATPAEQQEFVKLFTTLLSRSYLAKIRKNVETSDVSFQPTTVKEDRVIVHSRVNSDGQDISIDYRMYEKESRFRVYDVIVENVGLVSNYRSEFAGMLDSGDFPALLNKLREQVEKTNPATGK